MGDPEDGSAADRLRSLQRLVRDLAATSRVEDVARVLIAATIATLGADSAGLWIVHDEVARLVAGDTALAGTFSLDVSSPIADAIRTGEPRQVASLLVVPFAAGGIVRGAVAIQLAPTRTLDREERELATTLVVQSAIAYERAELVENAARNRRNAAVAAQRFEKLREAMEALAAARASKDVAKVTVETGREAVNAIAATMWLHDPVDGVLKLAASHNVAEDNLAPLRVLRPDSRLPIVRVATTRTPLFISNEQELALHAPEIYPQVYNAGRAQPFAVLPLATDDRVLGAIAFTYAGTTHEFAQDEREFLFGLTRACEQALERARLLEAEAEARRVAEEANQRKDEFLAMLGHELRNPLAAITTALDLIKLREGSLSRELGILDRHRASLVHMVSDLLDVSRVTRGKVQLSRASCDLKASIEQALEGLRSEIEARGHTLSVDVPAGLLVDADQERLTQVLANLLGNAVQYTPDGGRIEARARDEADDIVIEVCDNGAGIESNLLSKIFEAFVQGPRTLDRVQGGLGIGLTLVKQIVELHGGRVSATSDGKGKGSTFVVAWPKASGSTTTVKMPALRRTTAMRVLVIDHDVDAADRFGRAIEGMGHEVVVVHDTVDALAAGERFAANIVFLDLAVGGYELANQLRALPSLHAARLVVLGPQDSRQPANEISAGVALHVAKPLDIVALAALLG